MKIFLQILFFYLFVTQITLSQRFLQNPMPQGDRQQLSAPSLIEQAYVRGVITLDQWVLYQAYGLRDPSKLPAEYSSTQPEKCATWVLDNIHRLWNSISPITKAELHELGFSISGILERPIGLDDTRTTAHFIVHYTIGIGNIDAVSPTDGDLNGTPDYIDTVLTTIENVWNVEVGTMGYSAPPPDSGDDRYDAYIFKLESGTYGYVQPEKYIGDNPNSPFVTEVNAFSSYLALRNNYAGFTTIASQAIKVTTAHEFYHAIQNGYDLCERIWMKEATATWSEDEVYDNINDNYQYLTNFFSHPNYPLDASNYTNDTLSYGTDNWYGSWIFFRYISEKEGDPRIVRRILERVVDYDNCNDDYSFSVISDVLAEKNSSFNRVFRDFTTSNLVRTIYPFRYREGAAYPEVPRDFLLGDTTISSSQPRYSSYYFQVPISMLPDCGKTLTVTFTSLDPLAQLGADLVSYSHQGRVVSEIPFQSSVMIPANEPPDSLFIVVMNFGATGTTRSYTLKVQSRLREAQYTLTDLGTIGNSGTTGTINNSGRGVGTISSSGGGFTSSYPVTWYEGAAQYLGGSGYAFDINNNNDVIGWVNVPGGNHAYLWGPAGSGDLDTTAGGYSVGWGVNDSGHAVGSAKYIENGSLGSNAQPTFWENGVMTKLPLLSDPNAIGGVALDINNSDQIIGTVTMLQPVGNYGYTTTVLWNGGGIPIEISQPLSLSRINDAGQYVGYEGVWEDVEGGVFLVTHTIIGSGGGYSVVGMSDGTLGASFYGRDINNAGDIVGSSFYQLGTYAFVYTQGAVHNLNEMLGFGTCWMLTNATGINDSGQIFGVGYPLPFDPTNLHAFVLTPIFSPTSISTTSQLPSQYDLYQNYPNPFNPSTKIKWQLPVSSQVTLKVYDILGKEVVTLVNEEKPAGAYELTWNASNLPSGVYFYRIQAENFIETKKMLLLK
jgi:uncharacterized membrane protein